MALHYYSLYIWLNIDSWSPMCKENITRLGTLKAQLELAHKFKKLTQYGDTAKHDETDRDRRLRHRLAGYTYVINSDDYIYVLSWGEPLLMTCSPDPADETVSKRAWEDHMGRWKADLRSVRAALSELNSALESHGF